MAVDQTCGDSSSRGETGPGLLPRSWAEGGPFLWGFQAALLHSADRCVGPECGAWL